MYGIDKAKEIILYSLKITEKDTFLEDELVVRKLKRKNHCQKLSEKIDTLETNQIANEFRKLFGKNVRFKYVKRGKVGDLYIIEVRIGSEIASIGKGETINLAKRNALKNYLVKIDR